MFQFKKFQTSRGLLDLNLERFAKLPQDKITKDDLKHFAQMSKSNLPQALAIINQLPLKRGDNGLFQFRSQIQLWGEQLNSGKVLWGGQPLEPLFVLGLLRVLNRNPRGDILGSSTRQSSEEGSRYSAPVPLTLSAFKQYRNIGYEEWDWASIESLDELDWFMDRDCQYIVEYRGADMSTWDLDKLLKFRQEANYNNKPLYQVTTANRISDAKFMKLPRIIKLMLLQLWVFHNSIRHPLAITNLKNFDEPALPLVDSEIMVQKVEDLAIVEDVKLPW
jgi:hypothetical protein